MRLPLAQFGNNSNCFTRTGMKRFFAGVKKECYFIIFRFKFYFYIVKPDGFCISWIM